jgi:hypothetical protein
MREISVNRAAGDRVTWITSARAGSIWGRTGRVAVREAQAALSPHASTTTSARALNQSHPQQEVAG